MQQFFSFEPESEAAGATPRGAVYTRPWVVELILDLAGYIPGSNLVDAFAVEPAVGEGAFLVAMVRRLVASCNRQGRAVIDCTDSLVAYEIDERSAEIAKATVVAALGALGVASEMSERLAASWVRTGDYLRVARHLPAANLVVGNPPYIRLEDIPEATMEVYRAAYPTMQGRADLYVAFFEAALRQLKDQGVCAYICADRWMFNQYGASLRQFITSAYNVETVVEMHNADAFHSNVSAYPAITVIRRERQGTAVVARATASLSSVGTAQIASFLRSGDNHDKPNHHPQR